jgi:hypothetical protein
VLRGYNDPKHVDKLVQHVNVLDRNTIATKVSPKQLREVLLKVLERSQFIHVTNKCSLQGVNDNRNLEK